MNLQPLLRAGDFNRNDIPCGHNDGKPLPPGRKRWPLHELQQVDQADLLRRKPWRPRFDTGGLRGWFCREQRSEFIQGEVFRRSIRVYECESPSFGLVAFEV